MLQGYKDVRMGFRTRRGPRDGSKMTPSGDLVGRIVYGSMSDTAQIYSLRWYRQVYLATCKVYGEANFNSAVQLRIKGGARLF
jgi:hypothetical protein